MASVKGASRSGDWLGTQHTKWPCRDGSVDALVLRDTGSRQALCIPVRHKSADSVVRIVQWLRAMLGDVLAVSDARRGGAQDPGARAGARRGLRAIQPWGSSGGPQGRGGMRRGRAACSSVARVLWAIIQRM